MHNKLLLILLLIAPTLRAGIYTAPNNTFPAVDGTMKQRRAYPGVTCQEDGIVACSSGTSGPMVDGETMLLPASGASAPTWPAGSTLAITKHIQVIGYGEDIVLPIDATKKYKSDMFSVTPDPTQCTLINVSAGTAISTNYPLTGRESQARISGIVFNRTLVANDPKNTAYLFNIKGQAYRHRTSGIIKGGLRIDHIRERNNGTTNDGYLIVWSSKDGGGFSGNYITGSFDHNFVDFTAGTKGGEECSFNNGGSPGGLLNGTGTQPNGYGQWDWSQDYTYGAGDTASSGTDELAHPVLPEIYIEDNIFNRFGFNLGTLGGGGRLVVRHNTSRGGLAGHGFESGNNWGTTSWEFYNNYIDQTGTTYTPPGGTACTNWRGGADIAFNNLFTSNGGASIAIQGSKASCSGSSIGLSNGRNFFDRNAKGAVLDGTGTSISPLSGTTGNRPDERIGDIYAKGTITAVANESSFTVALDSPQTAGNANKWKDFVVINTYTGAQAHGAEPENLGGQVLDVGNDEARYAHAFGYILSSNSSGGGSSVVLGVEGGANVTKLGKNGGPGGAGMYNFVGDTVEIRKVLQGGYFGMIGGGKVIPTFNGGNTGNNTPLVSGNPDQSGSAFVDPASPAFPVAGAIHKYAVQGFGGSPVQAPYGCYQWNNKDRNLNTGIFGAINLVHGVFENYRTPGGLNDSIPTNTHNNAAGTSGSAPYPSATPAATPTRVVGAEWDAPGSSLHSVRTGSDLPSVAYGSEYPNTMVSGAVVSANPFISSGAQDTFTTTQFRAFKITVGGFSGTTQTFSLVSPDDNLPSGVILNTGAGCSTPQPTPPAGQSWTYLCGAAAGGQDAGSPYVLHIRANQSSPSQQADQTNFQLFVNPSGSAIAPVITNSTLTATGQVGTTFTSYTITASNTPTSYSASGLPSGLSVNTSTGVISGTPAVGSDASSPYTVTLGATNSAGTGNATLTITVVGSSTPVVTSGSSATGTVGTSFTYTIAASNSPTSYSASSLPSGLSVNTTTGVISGVPTAAGLTNVTIGATNSSGTGTKVLALTVQTGIATPTPAVIQIIP